MRKTFITFLTIVSLTCLLQGCFIVLGGAAIGAAGAAILYDNRSMKTMMSDETLARDIELALKTNPDIESQCHVVISTYHGMVLLAGQAPTQALKDQIQKVVKSQPGIQRLYNEITIEGPTTGLVRSNDAWITTKVKTALLSTPDLKSSQIKVVTENGTVYLMGILSRDQAMLAINTTRTIHGVQKVVTAFQYKTAGA